MSFARAFNGDDRIMEGQNDGGTECCKEPRERLNDRPSLELAHRHGKQAGEHSNEKEEKTCYELQSTDCAKITPTITGQSHFT